MAKPDWNSNNEAWFSDPPCNPMDKMTTIDTFVVCTTHRYGDASSNPIISKWYVGWKTYNQLWSALRYGMYLGKNKHSIQIVKNIATDEIVWRSWEDENPYRNKAR